MNGSVYGWLINAHLKLIDGFSISINNWYYWRLSKGYNARNNVISEHRTAFARKTSLVSSFRNHFIYLISVWENDINWMFWIMIDVYCFKISLKRVFI